MATKVWKRLKSKLPSRYMAKIYIIVFINLFTNAYAITMLFPFLPFMVEFLIPRLEDNKDEVGKYLGIIAAALFIGRILGSYIWGALADRKGRKPIIVISGVLIALATLMFGFSVNFGMAIVARLLVGFFNGVVATCKAVISEVSDDSNQAFGISIVGSSFGLGYIIGPAISGAISDPIGQYNLNITNPFLRDFLTRFPYSLPCIVNFFLILIGVLVAAIFLPETLGKKKNRKRSEIRQDALRLASLRTLSHDSNQMANGGITEGTTPSIIYNDNNEEEETSFLGDESVITGDTELRNGDIYISNPATSIAVNSNHVPGSPDETEVKGRTDESSGKSEREGVEEEEEEEEIDEERTADDTQMLHTVVKKRSCSKYLSALRSSLIIFCKDMKLFMCDRNTLTCIILYSAFSYGVIGYNELYSLWAFTPPYFGGLGFSLHEIGISLSVIGVFMLPVSVAAFTLMEKRFKSIKSYYIIATGLIFLMPLLPSVHYLLLVHNVWLLWALLISIAFLIGGFHSVGFSAIFLFTNNSVPFDKLGSINGVSMMLASIARAISPIVSGSLFSLSLSETTLSFGFPADYHLVFVIYSVIYVTTVFMVACLPPSINHQKIIEDMD